MQIKISTKVNGNYIEVFKHFELPLFLALKPKFTNMEVLEFTGSRKGDKVHIKFTKPFTGEWTSAITEDNISNNEAYFIDEGVKMPFRFTYWKHKHIVSKAGENNSILTDLITFECSSKLRSVLYYPLVWFGMFQRKPVYRKFFRGLFP